MQALAWFGFAVGVALLLVTGSSVVKTLLIPRNLSSAIGTAVARTVLAVYRLVTARVDDVPRREQILASGAPPARLGQGTGRPSRPAHREPEAPDDPAGSPQRGTDTPLRMPG